MKASVRESRSSACAAVAENILLDGRLALFHQLDRWLAVADLHFGYELSQRAAGNLFPLWGMQTIENRLAELLADYHPRYLVLLGDLVHNRTGGASLVRLIGRLRKSCEVILIAGNHDRHLPAAELRATWQRGDFQFHHGHCETETTAPIQIIGHHHPAFTIRDGAGLRLKLPTFIQTKNCWIMPAFSPWAAGTEWTGSEEGLRWLCSPQRVLRIENSAMEGGVPATPGVPVRLGPVSQELDPPLSGKRRVTRGRRSNRSCNAGNESP